MKVQQDWKVLISFEMGKKAIKNDVEAISTPF